MKQITKEISHGVRKTAFIVFLGILVLSPMLSLAEETAQGLVPCGNPGQAPCQFCHFFVLFRNIIDFLLNYIVIPLGVLMIAIGGFMYVFAYIGPAEVLSGGQKGGPAMLSQAKRLLTSVIWGLVIIFAAWLIINTFFQIIGVQDWTGLKEGWWKIDCPITNQ